MEFGKLLVFIIILMLTAPAYAEYYVVYSESVPVCTYRCGQMVTYKKHIYHKKTHTKHHYVKASHKRNSYSISVYCPCSNMWVPSNCACCGSGVAYWEQGYTVSYTQPRNDGYVTEEYIYDPDLSTADDNALASPGMDIDN